MSIIQDIKAASLAARKERNSDKAASLTTLLSEASMIGKNDGGRETTDIEATAVIKKFIKNIDEIFAVRPLNLEDPASVKLDQEKRSFASFLPKQMTEEQVKTNLVSLKEQCMLTSPKDVGKLLKSFKELYEGAYDGGLAAKLAKEILS